MWNYELDGADVWITKDGVRVNRVRSVIDAVVFINRQR